MNMDVDRILRTFHNAGVEYVLICGMNFFLVHKPVATFDVDLWIADEVNNRAKVHDALTELKAEVSFSTKGDDLALVEDLPSSAWLERAAVFCLNSPHGAIDIFRSVRGLEPDYQTLRGRFVRRATPSGVPFQSLPDDLMIAYQLALPEPERKRDRLRALGHRL